MPDTKPCVPHRPPPAPHALEAALLREAAELVTHGEHLERLAADPLLDAWTGAKLLLKLTRCNVALLALCNEGETAVEEARDDAAFLEKEAAR
jgi:hypothetical protein